MPSSCLPPRPTRLAAAVAVLLAALVPALPAATITVDSPEWSDVADALCTLPEAIVAANQDFAYHGCAAGSGPDQVGFALPPGTTILATGAPQPRISATLTLAGPGADALTIDGADLQPLFVVDSENDPITVWIYDLTLAGGHATGPGRGGALTVVDGDLLVLGRVVLRDNFSESGGGAIRARGTAAAPAGVTLDDCLLERNDGGTGGGGGLHLDHAVAQVRRSSFLFNETAAEPAGGVARGGGAIASYDSTLAVRTSTFYGNSTFGSGGAIVAQSLDVTRPDVLSITDSTVVENVGDVDGDDLGNIGGVAIATFPGDALTAELQNTLLADNVDPGAIELPDLYVVGTGITSLGHNLVSANPSVEIWFPEGLPNANGDYVGTLGSRLDPALGPLDDWGGPTPVVPPLAVGGMPVIDLGRCWRDNSDQRGFVDAGTGRRPVDDPAFPEPAGGDGCDIGAVETGAVPPESLELPFVDGFEDGTTARWSSTSG